jgi:ATP phosphoribosyltransferase
MYDNNDFTVRFAIPSKGALGAPTLDFLADSGLKVFRPNQRQYVASIPSVPKTAVLFQRVADIVTKVDEGSVDLGITGYDIVHEQRKGHNDIVILYNNLRYGKCELDLAVPESWIDVSSFEDLAELSLLFRENGRELRIATKYPNLTRKWFYEKGITHFALVEAHGALEAAPGIGYADMIVDLVSTGTTLRENQLKRIMGGTILQSQACLIGNKRLLLDDVDKLYTVRTMLELIEAYLRAKKYVHITANIRGESPEAISRSLMRKRDLTGLRGPTISKVYSKMWGEDDWYAVNIVVGRNKLLEATDHLRKVGGVDIAVSSLNYVFDSKSWNYQELVKKLKR